MKFARRDFCIWPRALPGQRVRQGRRVVAVVAAVHSVKMCWITAPILQGNPIASGRLKLP
jgi:hypothetical protein